MKTKRLDFLGRKQGAEGIMCRITIDVVLPDNPNWHQCWWAANRAGYSHIHDVSVDGKRPCGKEETT